MPKFTPYNYDQSTMVVINYRDQLQPGTFEYAIHHLIDNKLDLSVFLPNYGNDDTGRPAYDPTILLKIILFAYSKGITSSREIQWCCDTNIIFKALSCDSVPHFTTIANFVSSHSEEIEELFEQILLVCYEQGLLGSVFSFDPVTRTCICPSEEKLTYHGDRVNPKGRPKAFFEGRLMQCRNCDLKQQCMKKPAAADHRTGAGR